MLVEARNHFDPLRAMVHLVKPAPEQVALVSPSVPPVVEESNGNVSCNGSADRSQRINAPWPMSKHPPVPSDTGNPHGADLDAV
jgi:hypothetical protein